MQRFLCQMDRRNCLVTIRTFRKHPHIHRHVTLRRTRETFLGVWKPFAPKGLTFSG